MSRLAPDVCGGGKVSVRMSELSGLSSKNKENSINLPDKDFGIEGHPPDFGPIEYEE